MKKLMHRLRFFISDAWDEFRHSPGINLLAVGTLATALFLAGLLLLVLFNVEHRVERLREDVRLYVYFLDDVSPERVDELRTSLAGRRGVSRVEHIDEQQALERYREWIRDDMVELLDELPDNPLPASLDVYLESGPQAEEVGNGIVTELTGREGIESFRFDVETVRRLESLLELARVGGSGLAVVVFAAVVFVMASVLRLAVFARRHEMEIMLLVGATPAFVRGPYLVAGLFQGLFSSGVALVAIEGARRLAHARVDSGGRALVELLAARPLTPALAGLIVLVGLLVSLISSWFAVRRGETR
ncbi:MAG: hypothetical protein GY716_20335 [bacterium]|nr:hypothetical protein [bacterium]